MLNIHSAVYLLKIEILNLSHGLRLVSMAMIRCTELQLSYKLEKLRLKAHMH